MCFEIVKMNYFEFDSSPTKDDYLHLFFGAERKYFILRVVRIIKSITPRWIFKEYPEIEKAILGWLTVGDGKTSYIIKEIMLKIWKPGRRNL